jgi:hypothetical protein
MRVAPYGQYRVKSRTEWPASSWRLRCITLIQTQRHLRLGIVRELANDDREFPSCFLSAGVGGLHSAAASAWHCYGYRVGGNSRRWD